MAQNEEPPTTNSLDFPAQWFADHPKITTLARIVGGGVPYAGGVISELDKRFTHRTQSMEADRLKTFYEELAKGEHEITDALIDSEDFLHCYFATHEAVTRTRRREKIVLFGRLLRNGIVKDDGVNHQNPDGKVDEFEEMLSLLESMSYTEIELLFLVEQHTRKGGLILPGDGTLPHTFNPYDELDMNVSEFEGRLTRLTRTGCVRPEDMNVTVSKRTTKWEVTGLYHKLKKLISDDSDKPA